jgi:hypothetical protein
LALIARGSAYSNRSPFAPTTAAFPRCLTGQLPRLDFRGLLSVHSCYDLPTRNTAKRHLFLEGFDGLVTSTAASIAAGWSDPVAGWDTHSLKNLAFSCRRDTRLTHTGIGREQCASFASARTSSMVLDRRCDRRCRRAKRTSGRRLAVEFQWFPWRPTCASAGWPPQTSRRTVGLPSELGVLLGRGPEIALDIAPPWACRKRTLARRRSPTVATSDS